MSSKHQNQSRSNMAETEKDGKCKKEDRNSMKECKNDRSF